MNYILSDFRDSSEWEFLRLLEQHSHLSFSWINETRASVRVPKWQRILYYLFVPLRRFHQLKKADRIVAWQQFFGLIFAFYCRLFHVTKHFRLYVMTFIYKPKAGLIGKVYDRVMYYIIHGGYIDKLIVYTENEVEYYAHHFGVPKSMFVFLPYSLEERPVPPRNEQLIQQDFIFAPGRSNRDYAKLCRIIGENRYARLHIACDTYVEEKSYENVTLHTYLFGEEMREYMYNSRCIAIPLKDPNIGSGQLVFLQAMQLGKPIVCTRCPAVKDYLIDGHNALLVSTDEEWIQAFDRLYHDPELYAHLQRNARLDYEQKFSINNLAKSMAGVLK